MMNVSVSNGELLDKLSILAIKLEKELDVHKEYDILSQTATELLSYPQITHLYNVLKCINEQLWDIEDAKRKHEQDEIFDVNFVIYARIVYMLNDERAKIKKYIDKISGSGISEVKSHRSY